MAIVSRELSYLFIHSPRTGGTALASGVLVPHLRGVRIPRRKIDVPTANGGTRTVRQHITRRQLLEAELITAADAASLFTFTTVRNPFDSLVSAYVKKRDIVPRKRWASNHPVTASRVEAAGTLSFPDYIESQYGSQRPHHLYKPQLEGADLVMRFEHLQDDFEQVLERLEVTPEASLAIPRRNETARQQDYRTYYTPSARAIVEAVFGPDLERFGYEF